MKNAYTKHSWMKCKLSLILLLLLALNVSGQQSISWINKNAYELKSGTSPANDDLAFLFNKLRDKNVIGLGEASHGTREFYIQKARMIEFLISNCGFKSLTIEAQKTLIEPINNYLQTGEGNLKELMKQMALYSTEEIYNLFQWIRLYNKEIAPENRVVLIGFDDEGYWSDPISRDKFMAENVVNSFKAKERKTIVWTHNVHLVKDTTSKYLGLGSYLKEQFGTQFYAIGFDTYQGSVNVLNNGEFDEHTFQAKDNSLSKLLAQGKYSSFFLPFDNNCPLKGVTSLITNIYSNWQEPNPLPIRPALDFDALVFIRDTSASRRLSQ
jgi:erythromycin esterase-like protein